MDKASQYYDNHVDQGYGEDDSKLDYYLDSILIAKKPAKIFSLPGASMPGSKVLRGVRPGDKIGKLLGWVKDKKNPKGIWLQLYDHAGYVFLVPGLFDKQTAKETSSGKKFVDAETKADKITFAPQIDAIKSFTLDFGAYIKWVLILIVIIIAYVEYRKRIK